MPPELPSIGLDSLEAIARNAPVRRVDESRSIADAQRGQLYVAEFVREPTGRLRCRPSVSDRAPRRLAGSTRARDGRAGTGLDSPRIRSSLPAGLELPDPALNYPDGSPADRAGPRNLGQRPARRSLAPRASVPPPELRRGTMGFPHLAATRLNHPISLLGPGRTHAPPSIKPAPSRPMDCSGTGSGSSGPRKIARPFAIGPVSSPADLDGKVVLDAGCGMGRYLRIAAESSARLIVGLDLSRGGRGRARADRRAPQRRRRARRPAPAPVRRRRASTRSTRSEFSTTLPTRARRSSRWPGS